MKKVLRTHRKRNAKSCSYKAKNTQGPIDAPEKKNTTLPQHAADIYSIESRQLCNFDITFTSLWRHPITHTV